MFSHLHWYCFTRVCTCPWAGQRAGYTHTHTHTHTQSWPGHGSLGNPSQTTATQTFWIFITLALICLSRFPLPWPSTPSPNFFDFVTRAHTWVSRSTPSPPKIQHRKILDVAVIWLCQNGLCILKLNLSGASIALSFNGLKRTESWKNEKIQHSYT